MKKQTVLFYSKNPIFEHLGLMYLSASLKRAGHDCGLETKPLYLHNTIEDSNPDYIAYSIMTGSHQHYSQINKQVKKYHPHVKSVAGGPHVTFFKDNWKDYHSLIAGEGENQIIKLVNGEQYEQEVIQDLDSLAFPDRSLFITEEKNPTKHFITSRTCPYSCSYCFNDDYKKMFGNRVRRRSVDNVIEELQEVKKNGIMKFAYFQDDVFTFNQKWLGEFTEKYKSKIGLPYSCHVRACNFNEDKAKMLKDSGCGYVSFAIEAGDYKFRKEVLNREMTDDQIIKTADLLHKYGLKFRSQNMLFEDMDLNLKTLALNARIKPTYAWASILSPIPHLEISKRYPSVKLDDITPDFFNDCVLPVNKETKNEILVLQRLFDYLVDNYYGIANVAMKLKVADLDRSTELRDEVRRTKDTKLFGFDPLAWKNGK